jgi:DNA-binding NtrC family response regulator
MKDPQNQIIGICGIARDITERKLRFADTSSQKPRYPSTIMQRTLLQAELVAGSNSITLLMGESGSGKDFLARYLHEHSTRSSGPFFAINCAALTPELVESELFGHEQGAFTGSHGRKRGLLELAEGGTLLLNEVGELHPRVQSKLLTFLDTESFLRVGGEKVVKVNARIIAATNRNLEAGVKSGDFREDLYHRLNVFSIYVPPLRERMEDLPLLISELLLGLCAKMGMTKAPTIDPVAQDLLMAYDWPGNVRELRNVLERALILSDKQRIAPQDLNIPNCRQSRSSPNNDELSFTLRITKDESIYDALTEAKRFFVTEGLKKSGNSIKNAARILGITRDSFVHLMRSLKIRR